MEIERYIYLNAHIFKDTYTYKNEAKSSGCFIYSLKYLQNRK